MERRARRATLVLGLLAACAARHAAAVACSNPMGGLNYRIGDGEPGRGAGGRPWQGGGTGGSSRRHAQAVCNSLAIASTCRAARPPARRASTLPALASTVGPSEHAKRLAYTKKWQDNNSLDFLAPAGTPVYALVDGVVCDPAKNPKCV
jgi:murein DD-endopeptidase MepM/ murein hydrolase activator NlpD